MTFDSGPPCAKSTLHQVLKFEWRFCGGGRGGRIITTPTSVTLDSRGRSNLPSHWYRQRREGGGGGPSASSSFHYGNGFRPLSSRSLHESQKRIFPLLPFSLSFHFQRRRRRQPRQAEKRAKGVLPPPFTISRYEGPRNLHLFPFSPRKINVCKAVFRETGGRERCSQTRRAKQTFFDAEDFERLWRGAAAAFFGVVVKSCFSMAQNTRTKWKRCKIKKGWSFSVCLSLTDRNRRTVLQ